MNENSRQIHKVGPSRMYGQHNVRVTIKDNIEQSIDKGDPPNPRIEIDFSDWVWNRSWVPGLEGRDSTDLAAVTESEF